MLKRGALSELSSATSWLLSPENHGGVITNGHRASERAEGLSQIIVILTTIINGLMHPFVFMRDFFFSLCFIGLRYLKKTTKKKKKTGLLRRHLTSDYSGLGDCFTKTMTGLLDQ